MTVRVYFVGMIFIKPDEYSDKGVPIDVTVGRSAKAKVMLNHSCNGTTGRESSAFSSIPEEVVAFVAYA